jgi:hypothetical protein
MTRETSTSSKSNIRRILSRALKATIKGAIFYVVYIVLSQLLAPISEYVPNIQQIIEIFAAVYISLVIVTELVSGTIFQHVLNTAKSLFVIAYVILSLKTGVFALTAENMSLVIDLRLFLAIGMLLGLLGLAKSVMQTINYVNEKAELTQI